MGSSAGIHPPDADPVGDARKRLVKAIWRLSQHPGAFRADAEAQVERALDEWWEAKERESSGGAAVRGGLDGAG